MASVGAAQRSLWGSPRGSDAVATRKLTSRLVWEDQYKKRLRTTDVLVVILSVALAHIVRFGDRQVATAGLLPTVTYTVVSIALAALWVAFLAIFRTRSSRVIGNGAEEYRRIVSATFRLFGVIAIVSLLFRIDIARLYLAIALPVGLLTLLLSRWIWRKAVTRLRSQGEYKTSVLIVGSPKTDLSSLLGTTRTHTPTNRANAKALRPHPGLPLRNHCASR